MSGLHERNAVKMFGGWVRQYSHESSRCAGQAVWPILRSVLVPSTRAVQRRRRSPLPTFA